MSDNNQEVKLKFSYSTDAELYYGEFDTVEAACDEAAAELGVGRTFWVGENVSPRSPEEYFDSADWLERVSCCDEYSGEWADGWDQSTAEQRKELDTEVRSVMRKWMARHNLSPKFWNVVDPRQFHVAGKVGEVFEIEAV